MSDEKQAPDGVLQPQLWTARTVEETQALYTDWAASYDAEVSARGYHTPRRVAEALANALPDDPRPVLDFGCGTGLGGMALRAAGIAPLDGTDINAAMLEEAGPKGIYDTLWVSEPGTLLAQPGQYRAIVAIGVISLGAAPPETLDLLVSAVAPGDLIALSFNDPTLADGAHQAHLDQAVQAGHLAEISRSHGPHLDDVSMGSDVIVLSRL